MRSVEEYAAEVDSLLDLARQREAAKIKRLKQRIARICRGLDKPSPSVRDINRCIDEWWAKESAR